MTDKDVSNMAYGQIEDLELEMTLITSLLRLVHNSDNALGTIDLRLTLKNTHSWRKHVVECSNCQHRLISVFGNLKMFWIDKLPVKPS